MFLSAKEAVVVEGEQGLEMFFVGKGMLKVQNKEGTQHYATLKRGQHFGEIALVPLTTDGLRTNRRTASCVTVTNCELYRFQQQHLEVVFEEFEEVSRFGLWRPVPPSAFWPLLPPLLPPPLPPPCPLAPLHSWAHARLRSCARSRGRSVAQSLPACLRRVPSIHHLPSPSAPPRPPPHSRPAPDSFQIKDFFMEEARYRIDEIHAIKNGKQRQHDSSGGHGPSARVHRHSTGRRGRARAMSRKLTKNGGSNSALDEFDVDDDTTCGVVADIQRMTLARNQSDGALQQLTRSSAHSKFRRAVKKATSVHALRTCATAGTAPRTTPSSASAAAGAGGSGGSGGRVHAAGSANADTSASTRASGAQLAAAAAHGDMVALLRVLEGSVQGAGRQLQVAAEANAAATAGLGGGGGSGGASAGHGHGSSAMKSASQLLKVAQNILRDAAVAVEAEAEAAVALGAAKTDGTPGPGSGVSRPAVGVEAATGVL
jgi:hypothetical protein